MKIPHPTRKGPGRCRQNISVARRNLAAHNDKIRVHNATCSRDEVIPYVDARNLPADFPGAKLIRAALNHTIGHRC